MAPSSVAPRSYNLLILSFIFLSLPATILLLSLNYAAAVLVDQRVRLPIRRHRATSRKTVLVTGSATAHGLTVARAFHRAGYRVVGADLGHQGLLNIAKRSRAISKHHDLPQLSAVLDSEYLARCVLIIIEQENAALWIDCSQELSLDIVTAARAEVENKTACACFAADLTSSKYLQDRDVFLEFLRANNLPASELHQVKSRGDIHNILNEAQGRKQYLLTSTEKRKVLSPQTLLPRRTVSQTYHDISLVKITSNSQMVLEQYFDPSTVYECSAVVVRGSVKMFWARQNSGEIYGTLAHPSALWQALENYTNAVVRELGHNFSSHLTLHFGLNERITTSGVAQQILPVSGSLRLDPTFMFPAGRSASTDLVKAYCSLLQSYSNGTSKVLTKEIPPLPPRPRFLQNHLTGGSSYFLLEDITKLLIEPCTGFLLRRTVLTEVLSNFVTLLYRLLFWNEAYFDLLDPVPAFWQYTVVFAWTTLMGSG